MTFLGIDGDESLPTRVDRINATALVDVFDEGDCRGGRVGYGGLEAATRQGVEKELCWADLFWHIVHG